MAGFSVKFKVDFPKTEVWKTIIYINQS